MELFSYYFNISNIPNYLGYWGYIFHKAKCTFYLVDALMVFDSSITYNTKNQIIILTTLLKPYKYCCYK